MFVKLNRTFLFLFRFLYHNYNINNNGGKVMKKKKILYKRSPAAVTTYGADDGKQYVVFKDVTFQVDPYGNVLNELKTEDVQVINRYIWYYNQPGEMQL